MAGSTSRVVILGAAGTGLMMAETVERCVGLAFGGFLDDDPAKQADGYGGREVLGPLAAWSDLPNEWLFLSSLYGPKRNVGFARLVEQLGIPAGRRAMVVAPNAVVSPTARVAGGVFVADACVIEPEVRLGPWCVLLGSVHVGHHTKLAAYVACGNQAAICGGVNVGEEAFIGAAASIREYVRVGRQAVIGLGSVVVRDVADGQTVAGNPARPLAPRDRQADREGTTDEHR